MKIQLMIPVVCVFAVACGSGSKSDDPPGKQDEIDTKLTGTWDGPCQNNVLFNAGHRNESVEFTVDGGFVKHYQQFTGDNCTQPFLSRDLVGTYAKAGDVEGAPNARKINYTVKSLLIKPETADAANRLNQEKYCGSTDWAAGNEKNVINANCGGTTIKEGQVFFDIYQQDAEKLYFGQSMLFIDGSSSDTRPGHIDTEHVYTKK